MSAAHDRFRMALVPGDQAMWASEQKWGVGRLERLVFSRPRSWPAYRRGWDLYRTALEASDAAAVETVGPKMIAALVGDGRRGDGGGSQATGVGYLGGRHGQRSDAGGGEDRGRGVRRPACLQGFA